MIYHSLHDATCPLPMMSQDLDRVTSFCPVFAFLPSCMNPYTHLPFLGWTESRRNSLLVALEVEGCHRRTGPKRAQPCNWRLRACGLEGGVRVCSLQMPATEEPRVMEIRPDSMYGYVETRSTAMLSCPWQAIQAISPCIVVVSHPALKPPLLPSPFATLQRHGLLQKRMLLAQGAGHPGTFLCSNQPGSGVLGDC